MLPMGQEPEVLFRGKLVISARHVLCLDLANQSLVSVSIRNHPRIFVFFLDGETCEVLSHAHLNTKHWHFDNEIATSVIVGSLTVCQDVKSLARAQTA
jgi:hypothetical protein